MKYERYHGEFAARGNDSVWRVVILQEMASAPNEVGKLSFPGRECLQIEWPETSKEEVLCGSMAVLQVLSPGDRTYYDLYTVEAGEVLLRVYKDGNLYWTGTLDPEQYEEPYAYASDYPVTLTFSDLGVLGRMKYTLRGIQTLRSILTDGLNHACLSTTTDESMLSTCVPGVAGSILDAVSVTSDNFEDEEGEWMNLHDVFEGIFQPLGIRIVQRMGKIYVYDLAGLLEDGNVESITWHDSDQWLSADVVYNKVKITFSPYSDGEILKESASYLGNTDPTDPASNSLAFWPDYSVEYSGIFYLFGSYLHLIESPVSEYVSFELFHSPEDGDGVGCRKGATMEWFHIEPVFGGSNHDGVMFGCYCGCMSHDDPMFQDTLVGHSPSRSWKQNEVLRTYRRRLQSMTPSAASGYYLCLKEDILFDGRYNPFEEAGDENEGWFSEQLSDHMNYLLIPFSATIYDDEGQALYHYDNSGIAFSDDKFDFNQCLGQWLPGEDVSDGGGSCLEWYDTDDRKGNPACSGWSGNRHCVGIPRVVGGDDGWMPRSLLAKPAGQYMPYPPCGGWIEIRIYSGFRSYDDNIDHETSQSVVNCMRWQLYKVPTLEVVRSGLKPKQEKVSDVEYSGEVLASAAEVLELDTICGTMEQVSPTSKGVYLNSSDRTQLMEVERSGRRGLPEKLLIGTLHSQYGSRHTKLSGTCNQLTDELCVYQEHCQGNRRFMVTADLQDCDAGTSEMTLVEVSADEYDATA